MKQISLLGCGWLGFPLAVRFIEREYAVHGSTTTPAKISQLYEAGIVPFLIQLGTTSPDALAPFLEGSDTLIIDIPPQLKQFPQISYVDKIGGIIPLLERSGVRHVIFVSSTSVYSDADTIVTEATLPDPQTERAKQILAVEELLLQNRNFATTILRFGGLIGEDRHPVKYLSGRKDLPNPEAPVNLIHREDCIKIILQFAAEPSPGIFNAVHPEHPTRREYYQKSANERGIPEPEFSRQGTSGKAVSSAKLIETLNYRFDSGL